MTGHGGEDVKICILSGQTQAPVTLLTEREARIRIS
jgi:hypothetical protein